MWKNHFWVIISRVFCRQGGKKVSAKSDMYSSNSELWKFAPSGKPVGKTVIYEVNWEISLVSKIGPDKRWQRFCWYPGGGGIWIFHNAPQNPRQPRAPGLRGIHTQCADFQTEVNQRLVFPLHWSFAQFFTHKNVQYTIWKPVKNCNFWSVWEDNIGYFATKNRVGKIAHLVTQPSIASFASEEWRQQQTKCIK